MSIVHLIDTVTAWAQVNICDRIRLKVPPENDKATDAGYEYILAAPVALPMYLPTSEKLPPKVLSPFPSLCVRFLTGQDDMSALSSSVEVQFCFSAWDPGLHGGDMFIPKGNSAFGKMSTEEKRDYFVRNGDGWRDAWNFVDIALRAIESAPGIGDLILDRSIPVKFGPLVEQDSIPDFYPYWFAWVSFTLTKPIQRNLNLQNVL